jgi:hypothetical protein
LASDRKVNVKFRRCLKFFETSGEIYANRYRLDVLCRKFIDVLLNTSQLEVTTRLTSSRDRSPVAAIEDQQHRFRRI